MRSALIRVVIHDYPAVDGMIFITLCLLKDSFLIYLLFVNALLLMTRWYYCILENSFVIELF